MNGYDLMRESYIRLAEDGAIDKATADKAIRIYDFLAKCDDEDKNILADSSAFNDIMLGYLNLALDEVAIPKKTKVEIVQNFKDCLGVFNSAKARECKLR